MVPKPVRVVVVVVDGRVVGVVPPGRVKPNEVGELVDVVVVVGEGLRLKIGPHQ